VTDGDRASLHALRSSDRRSKGRGRLSLPLVVVAVAQTPTSLDTPAVAAARRSVVQRRRDRRHGVRYRPPRRARHYL